METQKLNPYLKSAISNFSNVSCKTNCFGICDQKCLFRVFLACNLKKYRNNGNQHPQISQFENLGAKQTKKKSNFRPKMPYFGIFGL